MQLVLQHSEAGTCPSCGQQRAPLGFFRLYLRDREQWVTFAICALCLSERADEVCDACS